MDIWIYLGKLCGCFLAVFHLYFDTISLRIWLRQVYVIKGKIMPLCNIIQIFKYLITGYYLVQLRYHC